MKSEIKPEIKKVAIIQARMGSSRLPGKVLMPVLDRPLLDLQIERIKRSQLLDEVWIATSTAPQDDAIARFCEERSIRYHRGSENDVLSRFHETASRAEADLIVRLTADCPLIDPAVIDRVIQTYLERQPNCDYVSNCLERSYPRGMDAECFPFRHLDLMFRNAHASDEREHVTPYLYRRPQEFRLANVARETDEHRHRWTVDTAEDFELIRRILEDIVPRKGTTFSLDDLLATLQAHPDWEEINAHIEQKKV